MPVVLRLYGQIKAPLCRRKIIVLATVAVCVSIVLQPRVIIVVLIQCDTLFTTLSRASNRAWVTVDNAAGGRLGYRYVMI